MQRRSFNFKSFILLSYSCGSSACVPLFCVERNSSREAGVNVNDGKTCERDASRYTIGVHKALPPRRHNCLFPSALPLFCPASFVLVFITARGGGDTKNLALV